MVTARFAWTLRNGVAEPMVPRNVVHDTRLGWFPVVIVLAVVTTCRGELTSWPASFIDDADLHAVTFIDARHGWAVGDRGAIWHTSDGGQRWERQAAPTTASLHGVSFIDERRGWIVGGAAMPYAERGYGVVLRTDDGGLTWLWERRVELPFLRSVHFANEKIGFAVGDGSPLFPSGIYSTHDSGRTWNPIAVRGNHGWTAAVFQDQGGVAISGQGDIVTFNAQQGMPAAVPTRHDRLRAIASQDRQTLWAVGDGSRLWRSVDGGHTWQDESLRLDTWRGLDLRAIACHGSDVWIAGAIGPRLLHSPDAGQTWQAVAIDISAPISAMTFVNATDGWAVGQLGCVLVTHDGGQNWEVARGRGRRIALLGIFATADDVPWTAFAQASCVYDARCRLVVLEQGADPPFCLPFAERLQQSALQCGVSNAHTWNEFPIGDSRVGIDGGVIAEHWRQLHRSWGESIVGVDRLRQRIRHELEVWQPDVVLTGQLPVSSAKQREADIRRLMQIVIQDEARQANRRVLQTCPEPSPTSINVAASELSLSLGTSVGQIAAVAASYLEDRPRKIPPLTTIEALVGGGGGTKVLAGIANEPGGPARRSPSPAAMEDWHQLQQRTQQYVHAEALIEQAAQAPISRLPGKRKSNL